MQIIYWKYLNILQSNSYPLKISFYQTGGRRTAERWVWDWGKINYWMNVSPSDTVWVTHVFQWRHQPGSTLDSHFTLHFTSHSHRLTEQKVTAYTKPQSRNEFSVTAGGLQYVSLRTCYITSSGIKKTRWHRSGKNEAQSAVGCENVDKLCFKETSWNLSNNRRRTKVCLVWQTCEQTTTTQLTHVLTSVVEAWLLAHKGLRFLGDSLC